VVTSTSQFDMTAVRKGCLDSGFMFDNLIQNSSSNLAIPKGVFLTGATGFVGVFILYELLKQGITTHCLVRAHCIDKARQRLVSTLQEYGLWEPKFASLMKPLL